MPLTPSSYKKIFKSKYVQDDSDEEPVDNDDLDTDYKPTTSANVTASYSPSYTTPTVSTTSYTSKKPLLTSAYLDSHPELNITSPSSYLDKVSKSPSRTPLELNVSSPSSYLDKISKSPSRTPLLRSSYLESLESRSYETPERAPLSRLPPLPQRATPSRRTFDEVAPFSSDHVPSRFQTRPMRNLTVVSRSITPVRSVNRSPSPVDSISWRSNKSTTPAPRRIYPQTSATVNWDDLEDKEEAPVIFDANLTFVLGCKGKMKQNLTPIPAHVEKDTASNCLTSKISDFLKKTDHVMEEWKSVGRHKNNSNSNLSIKERALMERSKSAANIMIKGYQLFSKASSCSRSSIRKDMSDCTEAEADEVLAK